jgi:hypothetical protein
VGGACGWLESGLRSPAVGAQDLGAVGKEATPDERRVASVAVEAFAVPVTIVERYEFCSAETSDRFRTPTTLLGEQVAETVGTVRLLVT